MISGTRVLKALFVSLVLAASAYGMSKLNLFGLSNSSDRLADQIYQRVTAADYGPDRKGQKAISVVYLDETSVDNLKGYGWTRFPPTFDQQWTMFDDLLNVGGAPPAAMFVDFVYMGQGGPGEGFDGFVAGIAAATHADAWADKPGCIVDPLMKIACIVAAGGTPMIFAKPSPVDLDLFTDAQRALDRVAVLAPALVGQQAYPMTTDYGFDAARAKRLGVHGFDVSPSLGMYAAWCVRAAGACGIPAFAELKRQAAAALAGRAVRPPDLSKVFDAPLDVVWGSRPDPAYLAMTQAVSGQAADCRGAADGWRERLWEQWAGSRGAGSGAQQECPYALTLGYDRLVSGQGLEQKDLERLLAGKLLLVGGHFRASNDWVESPVHGQVPGVHYHAMALDNLVETGTEYRRNANTMFDSDFLQACLIAALAFCGVLGVMMRNNLLDKAIEDGMEPRLRATVYGPLYLALFTVSIGLVLAATWAGVTYAHRSPINWIGISSVAMGFLFYATRQTLPADIAGSVEKIPVVRHVLTATRLWFSALKFEEDRLVAPKPPRPPPSATAVTPAASTPTSPDPTEKAPAHA